MRSAQKATRSTGARTSPAADDDGHHDVVLAQLARHAVGGGVEDKGVQLHHLLDLEGGDVLAPPPDRIGRPADEVDVPLGVAPHEVARVEPEVAPRGERGLRLSVVAVGEEGRLVGPHDELADLTGRHLAVRVVDHGDVVLGDGATAAARAARFVERLVDGHAGIGRAVGLDQAEAEALLELGRELRDGHTPGQPDRVILVVGRRRSLVQHRQRGAHEVEDRRTEPAHLGPEARRGEAAADGRRRPEHERRHHRHHAGVEVEERERRVEDVVRAQPEVLDHQLGLAHGVAVGEHAPLRRTGRARGEQDHRGIGDRVGRVWRRRIPEARHARGRRERRVVDHLDAGRRQGLRRSVRHADDDRTVEAGALGDDRAERGHQRVVDDDQPGRRQVERVGEGRTSQGGVDQGGHRAQPAQGQPGDHEVGAVGQDDGHQLAARDAQPGQARGQRVDAAVGLGEGQVAVVEAEEHPVGDRPGLGGEERVDGRDRAVGVRRVGRSSRRVLLKFAP